MNRTVQVFKVVVGFFFPKLKESLLSGLLVNLGRFPLKTAQMCFL